MTQLHDHPIEWNGRLSPAISAALRESLFLGKKARTPAPALTAVSANNSPSAPALMEAGMGEYATAELCLRHAVTLMLSSETKRRAFLEGFNGAPCTSELKVAPRLDFQLPSDTHVFGYTADVLDRKRADRMLETYPEMKQLHPLIERGLTKANVLAIIQGAGIDLPVMYGLGFHNNNCIPCVKATSPAYWAAIRLHFPEQFDRMSALSRKLGVRLVILRREAGKNVRGFIDEIPASQSTKNPIAPACDFLCQAAAQDLDAAA